MKSIYRPTKSEIFTIYNKMRSFARKNPHLLSEARVNKALGIMLSNDYYGDDLDRLGYTPTANSCGCKDWQYHNAKRRKYTGPCKHMIAAQMMVEIENRRQMHEAGKSVIKNRQ